MLDPRRRGEHQPARVVNSLTRPADLPGARGPADSLAGQQATRSPAGCERLAPPFRQAPPSKRRKRVRIANSTSVGSNDRPAPSIIDVANGRRSSGEVGEAIVHVHTDSDDQVSGGSWPATRRECRRSSCRQDRCRSAISDGGVSGIACSSPRRQLPGNQSDLRPALDRETGFAASRTRENVNAPGADHQRFLPDRDQRSARQPPPGRDSRADGSRARSAARSFVEPISA